MKVTSKSKKQVLQVFVTNASTVLDILHISFHLYIVVL